LPNSVAQKFLVGVDDSEGSIRAVDYALNLAQKLGSSVCFVHVVTLADTGRKILDACEAKARERKIPFRSFLEVGEPSKVILTKAAEEECDCIVVGKMGQTRVAGNLMSASLAQQLVTLSQLPVICV
jgi:nucleotide-binding universal stress UspA family protein